MVIFSALIAILIQSGQVIKNNGEVAQLRNIEVIQKSGISSGFLIFEERNQQSEIELNKLKRINLKESLSKSKGVTNWLAILVEKDNNKHEVTIDIIEVRGTNNEGEVEVISANAINKISF